MSYKELANRLRELQPQRETFVSGVVVKVEGLTCFVDIGGTEIEANLRPTEIGIDGELLVVPKVGSAVVMASMNGDLAHMLVLAMDAAEELRLSGKMIINDGVQGGLININALTKKLNAFVDSFNTHTHTGNMGAPTSIPMVEAKTFVAGDYEDTNVTH